MKSVIIALILLIVLGTAGFLYRGMLEHATPANRGTACTADAKICPDGTSVGRTGPSCSFAACPAGNIEFSDVQLAFALPAGYVAMQNASSDPTVLGAYQKQETGTSTGGVITISDYAIPQNETANDVILANTTYGASGKQAQDMNEFTPKLIGGHTFQSVVIERFEGHVESAYYLVRSKDVLRFDIAESNVANWTDPNLIVDNLQEHQALLRMLGTIQVGQ